MKNILLIIFITSLPFLFSCEEEDIIRESKRLALKYEIQSGNTIKLIWNESSYNDILKYIVVKTTEEKDESYYQGIAENYYSGWGYGDVIAIIDLGEGTEYIDKPGLESEYFYKIIALRNNSNYLLSNTLKYNQDGYPKLDFIPGQAILNSTEGKIVFANSNMDKMYIFDLETDSIIAEKSITDIISAFCTGNNGNGNEIYVINSNGYFTIFDFDLNEKVSLNMDNPLVSITTDNNGFIYIYEQAYYNSKIHSFSRSQNEIVNVYITDSYSDARIMYLPNQNKIVEARYNYLYLYNLDNEGVLDFETSTYNYNNYNIMEVFPNGSSFIINDEGTIFSNSLEEMTNLYYTNYNNYSSYAFSSTNIFAANYYEKVIEKFSINSFSYSGSLNTIIYPRFLYVYNNEIIVIGTNNTYNSTYQYYIEKITL